MKLSTKIALGIFALGVPAIAANAVWEGERPGEIVLIAPADGAARVRIDDGAPLDLAPGEVRRITAEHGTHAIHVEAPMALERTVTVESGRQHRGVPLLAEQCYVELDVTLSHYGSSAGRTRPGVNRVSRHDAAFEVPSTFALSEAELPDHTTDTVRGDQVTHVQLVQLFRPVPCAAADGGNDAVLAALGY